MIRVASITGIGEEISYLEGTVVLVQDANGNPLAMLYETQPGETVVSLASDNEAFRRTLIEFGVDKTVLCDELKPEFRVPPGARPFKSNSRLP